MSIVWESLKKLVVLSVFVSLTYSFRNSHFDRFENLPQSFRIHMLFRFFYFRIVIQNSFNLPRLSFFYDFSLWSRCLVRFLYSINKRIYKYINKNLIISETNFLRLRCQSTRQRNIRPPNLYNFLIFLFSILIALFELVSSLKKKKRKKKTSNYKVNLSSDSQFFG